MREQKYNLNFDGYWREPNASGIPASAGIYCVYTCRYDAILKTVSLSRLLYIGEAENVNGRITNHEKWREWQKYIKPGEQICFTFAPIQPDGARFRAEAALIYKHKPPVNTEYTNNFPFDTTHVQITGQCALLNSSFTVTRSSLSSLLYR